MSVWRRPFIVSMLFAVMAAPTGLAAAGSYDGSRPFLCSVTTVMECDASGSCERQIPDGVNTPKFIRVDVAARTVSTADKKSQLKNVARVDGELILQGRRTGGVGARRSTRSQGAWPPPSSTTITPSRSSATAPCRSQRTPSTINRRSCCYG